MVPRPASQLSPEKALPLDELWQRVSQLERDRQGTNAVEALTGSYLDAIAQISQQGGRSDYEKLVALYETIPIESSLRERLFEPLCEFGIQLELAALAKTQRTPAVVLATNEIEMAEAPKADPEVIEAWRAYRALTLKIETEFRRVESNQWLSIQRNSKLFRESLARAFHDPPENAFENLIRFRESWFFAVRREGVPEAPPPTSLRRRILRQAGSVETEPAPAQIEGRPSSATSTNPVSIARQSDLRMPAPVDRSRARLRLRSTALARALVLCSIRQGRIELALGTMLAANDIESSWPGHATPALNWRSQLIERYGLDWEILYAGAAADGYSDVYVRLLGQSGSAWAARFLAGMPRFSNDATQSEYLRAVASFITPSGPDSKNSAPPSSRGASDPIPAEVQRRLVRILCDEVNPAAERTRLELVSSLLAGLCLPETKETLKTLLASPFTQVQQNAATALKAMGEIEELPPLPPPVEFCLITDGKPLPQTPTNWRLDWPSERVAYRGALRPLSPTSITGTDREGCMKLHRDYFVDTKHPVQSVLFFTPPVNSLDGLWFMASAKSPTNLAARTEVTVNTSTLTVHIAPSKPNRQPPEACCIVRLRAEAFGGQWERASGDIELPLTNKVVFSSLQRGRYSVQLVIPGAALWESELIELTEQPAEVTAGLQPGADVKLQVVGVTSNAEVKLSYTLEQPGRLQRFYERREYRTGIWRGLPLGSYRIRIYSSAEFPVNEDEDCSFTITQATPALLDLGVIRLQAAKKE